MAADRLERYRAKRDFGATKEPQGGEASPPGQLYIIQKHAATRLHYDFRLELDGVLLSWAVTRGPSYNTKDKRLAVRTEDHPLDYGGFEGTIPKGNYGGGTVMLWDRGSWEPVGDPHAGLEKGKLAFVLHGERLRGHWALVRMKPRPKERHENWLLIKENDELANTHEDLLDANTSVVSGRTLDEIAEGPDQWVTGDTAELPEFCEPQLAALMEAPPSGKNWIFEIKYDGYRALIAADGGQAKIFTRSGLDWTARFPAVAKAAAAQKWRGVLMDCEICVLDAEGRSDFGALVSALETGKGALTALAFDLLFDNGEDLRGKTLIERKARLRKLLGKTEQNSAIAYSEDFPASAADTGEKLLAAACARGLEGIIAKPADAPYRAGRHGGWQKIKCGHEQEFVIVGFSPSDKARPFASLLMAVREDGALRYAGRVGSGFSDSALARLAGLRDKHKIGKPAVEDVPAAMRKGVTWVKPVMVAQVEFAGWTRDNQIRHGRFAGLREDKKPEAVVKEKPAQGTGVTMTHPDKVMFPEAHLSKQDLAAYFAAAADLMMPYAAGRFVSLVRSPGGIDDKHFFQRHPAAGFGEFWLEQKFEKRDGGAETYIYFEKPEALAAAVQMSALEFHIWGSRVDDVERPDRIVFDLDPDEAVGFETVKTAATRVREVLEALGLQSFALLSGGKGIHVVVPVTPDHEWTVVKEFSANVAKKIAEDAPNQFVATMTKAKRKGKIFIDHFRNERGSTAIAPYSPRARTGAPVAWPVAWGALDGVKAANAMTVDKAMAALGKKENGWAAYGTVRQRLTKAAIKAVG
jgi:bifunctional non-homologous end joining protein LigD